MSGIAEFYSRPNLAADILEAAGGTVTSANLSPYDELHVGGRRATEQLIDALGPTDGMRVLDIGCGLGGAARATAERTGAHVEGIDLSPDYIDAAQALSEACGLSALNIFRTGDALALPFEDGRFDCAYTIHASMNIEDKKGFFGEALRVLKPGSAFGVYDIMGTQHALEFPLPWAARPDQSRLASPEHTRQLAIAAGFAIVRAEAMRDRGLESLDRLLASGKTDGAALVMGRDFATRVAHLRAGIAHDHCAPYMMIFRRT